ncbi:MAG: peptide deformylase [Anaerolineae bacterium]|nr:peptide deformylase [Anaerolineae bacterium]
MATRDIIQIPDNRLRQKANPVKSFAPHLKQLTEDMLETMREHEGVGLAGPQIGLMQRIFVAEIQLPQDEEDTTDLLCAVTYALVNPEITKFADVLVEGQEGCLSMPGWVGLVERPAWVDVRAFNIEGKPLKIRAEGYLARVFMHEIDHLNGILYTDHITDPEKLWQLEPDDEVSLENSPQPVDPGLQQAQEVTQDGS